MTAKELRIEFYGKDDARAYDHDEIYLMERHAQLKLSEHRQELLDAIPSDEEIENLEDVKRLLHGQGRSEMFEKTYATITKIHKLTTLITR